MTVAQGTPNWKDADPEKLEPYFSHWMMELTAQGLHAKSDIAIVLAMQSAENAALSAQVVELQQQLGDAEFTRFALVAEMNELQRQLVHSSVTRASVPPSVSDGGT